MIGFCGHCNHEHIQEDQCADADCNCTEFDLYDMRICRCGDRAGAHKVGDRFGSCGCVGCNCDHFVQADCWFRGTTHLDMSKVIFFAIEGDTQSGHTVYISMERESVRLTGGAVDAFLEAFYSFKGWGLPTNQQEDPSPSRRILLQEDEP